MRRGKGNWTYGSHRSEAGRKGKLASPHGEGHGAKGWKQIQRRIDAIVAMAERADCTVGRSRLLRLPIKGVKV